MDERTRMIDEPEEQLEKVRELIPAEDRKILDERFSNFEEKLKKLDSVKLTRYNVTQYLTDVQNEVQTMDAFVRNLQKQANVEATRYMIIKQTAEKSDMNPSIDPYAQGMYASTNINKLTYTAMMWRAFIIKYLAATLKRMYEIINEFKEGEIEIAKITAGKDAFESIYKITRDEAQKEITKLDEVLKTVTKEKDIERLLRIKLETEFDGIKKKVYKLEGIVETMHGQSMQASVPADIKMGSVDVQVQEDLSGLSNVTQQQFATQLVAPQVTQHNTNVEPRRVVKISQKEMEILKQIKTYKDLSIIISNGFTDAGDVVESLKEKKLIKPLGNEFYDLEDGVEV